MPGKKKPTIKQRKFAAAFVAGKSAADAAVSAGYSPHSAKEIGYENLTKPTVRALVEDACAKLGIGPEYVLAGLKQNAERAMQIEAVKGRDGEETGEFTYQGQVANKSYELMGKAVGMFTDKHEVTGPNGGALQITGITRKVVK